MVQSSVFPVAVLPRPCIVCQAYSLVFVRSVRETGMAGGRQPQGLSVVGIDQWLRQPRLDDDFDQSDAIHFPSGL